MFNFRLYLQHYYLLSIINHVYSFIVTCVNLKIVEVVNSNMNDAMRHYKYTGTEY